MQKIWWPCSPVRFHLEMASLTPKPIQENARQLFQRSADHRGLARMRSARWISSTTTRPYKSECGDGGRHHGKGHQPTVRRRVDEQGARKKAM